MTPVVLYVQIPSSPESYLQVFLYLLCQSLQRALELASGSLPRGAAILPYQPLRAKRGTATPLLVAATAAPGSEQRRLASQPVPPVMLGASMVPIESMPRDVANRAIR